MRTFNTCSKIRKDLRSSIMQNYDYLVKITIKNLESKYGVHLIFLLRVSKQLSNKDGSLIKRIKKILSL